MQRSLILRKKKKAGSHLPWQHFLDSFLLGGLYTSGLLVNPAIKSEMGDGRLRHLAKQAKVIIVKLFSLVVCS